MKAGEKMSTEGGEQGGKYKDGGGAGGVWMVEGLGVSGMFGQDAN